MARPFGRISRRLRKALFLRSYRSPPYFLPISSLSAPEIFSPLSSERIEPIFPCVSGVVATNVLISCKFQRNDLSLPHLDLSHDLKSRDMSFGHAAFPTELGPTTVKSPLGKDSHLKNNLLQKDPTP